MTSLSDEVAARLYRHSPAPGIATSVVMWAIFVALSFGATWFKAIVLTDMWRWFAEPAGMPALNFATAVGVSLIVGFLTLNPLAKMSVEDDAETASSAARGIYGLLNVWFWIALCWGSAALWHFWIL